MFKLIYSQTTQNQIYTNFNIQFPIEDYYCVEDNIFCVTDGVTRDLVGGEVATYPKNKEEAQYNAEHYPNPSGAFEASKIIADNFVKYIKEFKNDIDEKVIKESIKKANKDVWKINEKRKIDYIGEDLYCSEAVGGRITSDYLYCFSIGDCYIKVFNENKEEIFCTENDHLWMEEFETNYLKQGEYNWENPRYRLIIRGALRNNYIITHNGKKVGYGALTGEDSAMDFVKIYKVPLENAKYICAYSDGCMPYFENEKSIQETLNNPCVVEKSGKERTLVVYEKN